MAFHTAKTLGKILLKGEEQLGFYQNAEMKYKENDAIHGP